jgi:hypothetical protein
VDPTPASTVLAILAKSKDLYWILPLAGAYHTLCVEEVVKMIESSVMVDVLIRERERELRALALRRAALHGVDSDRRHSLRERIGMALIQAGRALLRHGPGYSPARRRLA